jgi:hypothetical protein
MNKHETSKARRCGWPGIAAAMLLAAPMSARAMLVTVVAPAAQAPASFGSISAIMTGTSPAVSGSCADAPRNVEALEGAIVEARAQYWAYLMRQPGFSGSQADIPGADIANGDIRIFFYSRLRFWLRQDSIPRPSPETLQKINDVSQTIHMMTGLCG